MELTGLWFRQENVTCIWSGKQQGWKTWEKIVKRSIGKAGNGAASAVGQ